MKKGLKKTLAAVIALTMLMSMSVCAFAASLDVVTSYNVATDDISVTATVSGAGSDQVAFLAKKDNNIIWIDQQPAVDGTAVSTFKTSKANAGAIVNVGTTSTAASAVEGKDAVIELASYTVTVAEPENGKVVASASATTDFVTFTVYPAAGYEFDYATANDVAVKFIGDTKKVAVTADTTFKFFFKAVAAAEVAAPAAPSSATVAADKKSATVAGAAAGAVEYGMLIANAEDAALLAGFDTAAEIAGIDENAASGVRKYKALGANEAGQYIISLEDATGEFFAKAYKAVLYSVGSNVALSDVFDLQ